MHNDICIAVTMFPSAMESLSSWCSVQRWRSIPTRITMTFSSASGGNSDRSNVKLPVRMMRRPAPKAGPADQPRRQSKHNDEISQSVNSNCRETALACGPTSKQIETIRVNCQSRIHRRKNTLNKRMPDRKSTPPSKLAMPSSRRVYCEYRDSKRRRRVNPDYTDGGTWP